MAAGAERDEGERGSERGASGVRPAPSALPPARGARVARAPIRRRPAAAARLPARWTKPESPRPEPCPRPPAAATSPARAAPSPPAPCPSATPRSYLMTIAPRPGGRCSPPRLEVSARRPSRPQHRAALISGACSRFPLPCSPGLPPRSFNSGRVRAGLLWLAPRPNLPNSTKAPVGTLT